MKIHESVTLDKVMMAAQEQMFGTEDMGYCVACGEEAYFVEPDASGYECEACGEHKVYGAPELLFYMVV